MPITYYIDPTQRMIVTSGAGIVTDAELIAYQAQLRADPAFDPSIRQLVDHSAVAMARDKFSRRNRLLFCP